MSKQKTEVLILVRGGVVQSVYSNEDKKVVDICVLDMDHIESQPGYEDQKDPFKKLLASVHKVY